MDERPADDADALHTELQAEVRRRAAQIEDSPLADDAAALDHADATSARDGDGHASLVAALAALREIPRAHPVESDEVADDRTAEILARLDATERALEASLVVLTSPAHRHTALEGQVDELRARLRRAQRGDAWSDDADALNQRLGVLESVERSRQFAPWYSTEQFEASFRGATEDILDRYADLADWIAERLTPDDTVLDIGCGRGDLLELLRRREVQAIGIDLDAASVDLATSRGLAAATGDGMARLRDADSASLGGVTAIQVLEHLTPQHLTDFVALAADRVRPGGVVVVETVNPLSLFIYTHAMWLDPTHTQPIHPAYLDFVFQQAGFQETTVQFRSPTPDEERLQAVGDRHAATDDPVVQDLNRTIDRLNEVLFGPQDYAVLAIR